MQKNGSHIPCQSHPHVPAFKLKASSRLKRFSAAANELAAAAAEMIENAAEVSGFAYDLNPNDLSIKQLRPGTKGFNMGMPPTVMTHPLLQDRHQVGRKP